MTRLKALPIALLSVSAFGADTTLPNRENMVVHEWGTFTSVADAEGGPVMWASLTGPGDLPCFVIRRGGPYVKSMPALIRMETPVLYFYPDRAMTILARVDFPQGLVTEWYPKSSVPPDRGIEWSKVELRPGENPELPTSDGPSHYFAARETDSAPLRASGQWEKLLFYRGVGNFPPPVQPKFSASGQVEIRNTSRDALPLVMLFENHQGKIGYRVARGVTGKITLDSPELSADAVEVHQKLTAALEESGLYGKEARAMVETWKDSWFEEGMRVIYILPRSVVEAVLPLTISPAPAAVSRVFVGRVEMLSPHVRETIERSVTQGDVAALARWGRFLGPFELAMRPTSNAVRSQAGQSVLSRANTKMLEDLKSGSCVQ